MLIREARSRDAESIGKVVVDTWRTTYGGIVPQEYLASLSYDKAAERWRERLSDMDKIWPGWFAYVAEDIDSVVGFAGGGPSNDYGLSFEGELGFIYLLKAYQRLDVEALAALRLPPPVEREVETALRDFMRIALERDARSLPFLDEVRAGP